MSEYFDGGEKTELHNMIFYCECAGENVITSSIHSVTQFTTHHYVKPEFKKSQKKTDCAN